MRACHNLQFSKGSLNRPTTLYIFSHNTLPYSYFVWCCSVAQCWGFVIRAATRTCPATVCHFTQWYNSRTLVGHLSGRLPFRIGQWLGLHIVCIHLPMPSAGIHSISTMNLLLSTSDRQGAELADHCIKMISDLVIVVSHSWIQMVTGEKYKKS